MVQPALPTGGASGLHPRRGRHHNQSSRSLRQQVGYHSPTPLRQNRQRH
ncbi:hypothetical protein Ahy_Scaffold1g106946 isoform K [Arachis hypogaea]|uniref:Uncharacterized protein n=1 Tax=Arachis hypogaea TaxID=3818 RepID=A0A444WTQ5_ARAHY|nr:hypothetical protein Ahy_Scaffold1g106946 isoform K [Arachis hypogaea]